jgi:Domain of unknown function (DUF362)/FlgD Ig-like domain
MKQIKHLKIKNLILPLLGLASLIWILIRVVSKPSRASYPCVRAAAPLASTFVLYIVGMLSSALLYTKAKNFFLRSKYVLFSVALISSLIVGFFSFFGNHSAKAINITNSVIEGPNQPMGHGVGIKPGRVAWVYNPDATDSNCTNTDGDYWFDSLNTNQAVVSKMFSDGLQMVTNTTSDAVAWDSIFHYYNRTHGRGNVGYTAGEKIVIKVNNNAGGGGPGINTSPQINYALLHSLINIVGVAQANIGIGDPHSGTASETYDRCHTAFPNVNYWSTPMAVSSDQTQHLYTSDGSLTIKLPQEYINATYMINVPVLKKHHRAGISLCSKNHNGSVCPDLGDAFPVHYSLPYPNTYEAEPANTDYHSYRIFVDYMGNYNLGGKTILYVIDGIWSSVNYAHPPIKWRMTPFNNDWPSSIFMSQDPVAIESVGFDFLYKEFDANNPIEGGIPTSEKGPFPHFPGVDDFLHQAADPKNWPTGLLYAPNYDGKVLKSMGVHEHWNNDLDKDYSRNLGRSEGIELVSNVILGIKGNNINATESVFQNSPNPFNSFTNLQYKLNTASAINLTIYDINGKEITTLVNENQSAGVHKIQWNGLNSNGQFVPAGIYIGKILARYNNDVHYQVLKMIRN